MQASKSPNGQNPTVWIPKCTKAGDFEPVQCAHDIDAIECWCVDHNGVEHIDTRQRNVEHAKIQCPLPLEITAVHNQRATKSLGSSRDIDVGDVGLVNSTFECPASSCRMYCPSGFTRDIHTGCPKCQCRDPCAGIECPGGQSCQTIEVACTTEPCPPPVATCKKARSLSDLCPAGQPLMIADTPRPFLCGHDAGKPQCPLVYRCIVHDRNDYGVCCPASAANYRKPGTCPAVRTDADASSGHRSQLDRLCGGQSTCSSDIECPGMNKCCDAPACAGDSTVGQQRRVCMPPAGMSTCQQLRLASELLAIGEREGRAYLPACDSETGVFVRRQCSRNGLVCWCVDERTGHKLSDTMGAANTVDCDRQQQQQLDVQKMSQGRSVDGGMMLATTTTSTVHQQCDPNVLCASLCEYGFKIDHDGCATCECADPCDGFRCADGSHCEVATDAGCRSGSRLCASEPVCKPDLVYSNPCATGVPLASNETAGVFYCRHGELQFALVTEVKICSYIRFLYPGIIIKSEYKGKYY